MNTNEITQDEAYEADFEDEAYEADYEYEALAEYGYGEEEES